MAAPAERLTTRICAWAELADGRMPLIYDMPGDVDAYNRLRIVDAQMYNIPVGTKVHVCLVEDDGGGDTPSVLGGEVEPLIYQKTLTARSGDPADPAWMDGLDDLDLRPGPVQPTEALVDLAGEIADALAMLDTALDNRGTPIPVDVLAQLVDRLGVRAVMNLVKVFVRLGADVQGWASLSPGTPDGAGALQHALVWNGQHPTAFDLGITYVDHPLAVRAVVLEWLMTWSSDITDELNMVNDLSTKSAALLRVLTHEEKPPPVVDEDEAGEQS